MFLGFGAFFVGWAQQYDLGSAARMGPAFFPTMLGAMLFLLGGIVLIEGLVVETPDGKIEPFNFRALILVLGSVVAFGMLLRPAGYSLHCSCWSACRASAVTSSSCAMCCCCRSGCRCWYWGCSFTV